MAEDKTDNATVADTDFRSPLFMATLQASFRRAAERAKHTNTPLVVMQNDEIVKIPPHEIDAFVTRALH